MKKMIINLAATLIFSAPVFAQTFDSIKVYKYVKKLDRDTLVQTSSMHTTVNIDTVKHIVKINFTEDKNEIRGFSLKQTSQGLFEFFVKRTDSHPLTLVMYQLEIQPAKAIISTHYNYRLEKYKYKIVLY